MHYRAGPEPVWDQSKAKSDAPNCACGTLRSSCAFCSVLYNMASSAGDDSLQSFDNDAIVVGRAQEAEGWLQKLGMRFRGLQGRMYLEFCLNRRDVIAVMPTAGACSAARCRSCMCAMQQRNGDP